jgi:hypothetical protein
LQFDQFLEEEFPDAQRRPPLIRKALEDWSMRPNPHGTSRI